jgi:hypothetical protein
MVKLSNLDKLSDDDFFKEFVTQSLARQIVITIDSAITKNKLTYTQKQAIANLRDIGILNDIILGNFEKITITKLIDIFSIFGLGLSIKAITKQELASQTNPTTRH